MMNGAGWFMLGALTAVVWYFVVDTLIERRQRRLDRRNAEALDQIKDAIFNEPLPFGVPIVESDMVPDDKIYAINPSYFYLDGTQADGTAFVMNKQSMARIRNLKES